MFPITITVNNISDLQKVMSVLCPTTGVIETADKSRDTVDLQAVANKAEAKVAEEKSSPTPAATQASPAHTQPTAEAADAPAITYKDVQTAVVAAVKAGKRSNVVALLAEFGVEHAEKLTPEQWPAALAKLKGMVA